MFEHLFLAAWNILVCKFSLEDKGVDFEGRSHGYPQTAQQRNVFMDLSAGWGTPSISGIVNWAKEEWRGGIWVSGKGTPSITAYWQDLLNERIYLQIRVSGGVHWGSPVYWQR